MAQDDKAGPAPAPAAYPPPNTQSAPPAPAGYPGAAAPMYGQPAPGQPAPVMYYAPATYQPPPTMTLQQALSPEEIKKIRKMTWINFGCTMVQLGCSIAIIIILSNNLEGARWETTAGGIPVPVYYCYFSSSSSYSGPCRYAYSVASVSIFWGFILSLIQCMTLDCCGMGRLFEMIFDLMAVAWWTAGAITLTSYHQDAQAANMPGRQSREAIIALCWVTAAVFMALAVTNGILMKRYGKAYTKIKQQQQQMPSGQAVHMVHMAPQAYPQQQGYPQQQPPHGYGAPPQQQQPAGYPAGYPPAAGPAPPTAVPTPAGFPAQA